MMVKQMNGGWGAVRALAVCAGFVLAAAPIFHAQTLQEPNRGGTIDLAAQDPKVALERLRPAEGYEVNLFASEQEFPELAKPLAMTWDTRGRLWVLTSPTYPHYLPGEPPDDKLLILEDTDWDGRADKVTVFAGGLYIPTGFALGDGGVYVAQQPNLVFLRDKDGDDRADEQTILLHGFGTEDSHHSIHAFTWGPDGGLYFQEGTFLHSQVETPYGPVRLENAGVWRYDPRHEHLSVFVSYPFANPWGHVIDRWGQNFISDASNGHNYYGTAFSGHKEYPHKQRSMKEWTLTRVRPTAGSEFIRSRHFPESAQGNFIYNNVIGFQGIKQYRVQEEGSGFVGIEVEPLLQSTDLNFRPVALQFGPDGALYVADWFNPLIGHMQYSLRDPRRDRQRGRIWRMTATGRPLLTPPRIHGEPVAAQLELLKAYEDRTRYQARLALRNQPTQQVVAALQKWIEGLDPAHADYEHHLLEALWVYQHHDVVEPALLKRLLGAKEFRARAAAVRALHHWFDRVDGSMALLGRAVNDPAPRVRLEAVRALSFIPTADAAAMALEALKHPMDYYLSYALDSTIATLEPQWKPALSTRGLPAGAAPEALDYLLDRLEPEELASLPRSTPVFEALLGRAGVSPGHRREALEGLARAHNRSITAELVDAIRRLDGRPGHHGALADLARMLAATEREHLDAMREDLEGLARNGRSEVVRQGAFAAIVAADAGVEAAWTLTAESPRSRIDLLNAAELVPDSDLRLALSARIAALLGGDARPARLVEPSVPGRYVRIVLPGRNRTLQLAEVQVFEGAANVASHGKATQSSIVAGGAIGGHPAGALDGRVDDKGDGASVAFTDEEQSPWWEVDLGRVRQIDRIVVSAGGDGGRGEGLHLSVLDASREPVITRDGLRPRGAATLVLGGDFTANVQTAAIRSLAVLREGDSALVTLVAPLVRDEATREAAVAAIRTVPADRWPAAAVKPLLDDVLAYVRSVPPGDRTGRAFTQALELGRELAARLPAPAAKQASAALGQLAVRTIRIEAVPAQMKFDIGRFTVVAGEEIEIEFVNRDEMPHNVLITIPGALESVSLKAEEMAKEPDAFAKGFNPGGPEVLHATPLINGGQTARLRFTAPSQPESYPFVCTFPGHWRTMNGTMQVVAPPMQSAGR